MSQPGRPGATGRTAAPLKVVSERLTEDEARSAAPPAPAPAAPAPPTGPLPTPRQPAAGGWGPASSVLTAGPDTGWGPPSSAVHSAVPVLAPPSLPVVAPRPRRRLSDLWRLVFARRRAGRHRPETTPPHSWGMISPQRRRRRRWGRR